MIFNKDFSNGMEQKALEYVMKAFKVYSNRATLEENWEKWDKQYNSLPDQKYYEGTANLFPPETRRCTNSLVDFADETLWNSDPPVNLRPVGGDGDQDRADLNQRIILWQMEKIKLRVKMRQALRMLVKFGFVIVKIPYVIREKYIIAELQERKKAQGIIKQLLGMVTGQNELGKINKERITVYDNIDFQPKNPFNMFWNYKRPWDEQECIIERIDNVSDSHLRLMAKEGLYFGIKELLGQGYKPPSGDSKSTSDERYAHYQDMTGLSGEFEISENRHELLEASCDFDLDEDGVDEECIITIVDRKKVIRLDPLPYEIYEKPYLWCPWDELEGTSLGVGVPQLAERDQIALNDFMNQIMDNISAILDCAKIVDAAAEIPDKDLKSRPNLIIQSQTGVDAVRFITPPNTTPQGMQAVAMVKESIRQSTGATATFQGLPSRYDTSATESRQMNDASARGVFSKLREIEDRILKEFLRWMYSYNLQFMSREDFIKILGKRAAEVFMTTSAGDNLNIRAVLLGDYDFIPLGVTQLENKVVKGQQLLNLLNIALKMPPGIANLAEMFKDTYHTLGGRNEKVLLPQPTDVLISPRDENILMSQGETVHAHQNENHQLHLMTHLHLQLPPQLEQLRQQHIIEHQQFLALLSQPPAGLPPQEQPRIAPEEITPEIAGKMTNLPATGQGALIQ